MAGLFRPHRVGEEVRDFPVARPTPQQRPQIPFVRAEEAGSDLAVGGDAEAAARAAERTRYGGDDADRPRPAVGEREVQGGA